jgi:hypothetical protein
MLIPVEFSGKVADAAQLPVKKSTRGTLAVVYKLFREFGARGA